MGRDDLHARALRVTRDQRCALALAFRPPHPALEEWRQMGAEERGHPTTVSVGLSVSDLRRGLDDYLAAVGRTWLTSWRADQGGEQVRYLIGMLNRARLAGYIRLPDDDTGECW